MANKIIKGDDLMLFDENGHSLAFATSHTLSMSADAVDVSSKDHGIWGGKEVNKINWEITSENLFTVEEFDSLFTKMCEREKIVVYFGLKKDEPGKTVVDGDLEYWTKGTSPYGGYALITSLSSNANSGENATFSITLTGVGKFTKDFSVGA